MFLALFSFFGFGGVSVLCFHFIFSSSGSPSLSLLPVNVWAYFYGRLHPFSGFDPVSLY